MFSLFLFRFISYFSYYIKSSTNHYLHAPFVFSLYQHCLQNGHLEPEICKDYRYFLYNNYSQISIEEYGAKTSKQAKSISISSHAKNTSISIKYGIILHQLILFFRPKIVLELGTSLGLSTLYMVNNLEKNSIYTLDAQKSTTAIAQHFFSLHNIDQIHSIQGLFDNTLLPTLHSVGAIDFVFIDGNHSYDSTKQYVTTIIPFLAQECVILLDDIRWNASMNTIWNELCTYPLFNITIDIGRMGLLIVKNNKSPKQHFCLR